MALELREVIPTEYCRAPEVQYFLERCVLFRTRGGPAEGGGVRGGAPPSFTLVAGMATKRSNPVDLSDEVTEETCWMALGPTGWLACNPEWKAPLNAALKDGTLHLRLQHHYQNAKGKWKTTWYSIDLTDINDMKQKNEDSGTERQLAAFRQAKLVASALTLV